MTGGTENLRSFDSILICPMMGHVCVIKSGHYSIEVVSSNLLTERKKATHYPSRFLIFTSESCQFASCS